MRTQVPNRSRNNNLIVTIIHRIFSRTFFDFREVNEDNMLFRNISAEFLEDSVILVSVESIIDTFPSSCNDPY